MSGNFFDDQVLAKNPPIKRAAYSDRTAWILAELSRLVYEPLPPEISLEKSAYEIVDAVNNKEQIEVVEMLVKKAAEADKESTNKMAEVLKNADFELIECFAVGGTEAFLVKRSPKNGSEGMLVLAFRGTQPTKLQDLMTDARLDLVSAPSGGRVHKGFLEAFQLVEQPIRKALEAHSDVPVYITGHSLGGALAMIATRYLGSDSSGATYTYGCPRVADEAFFEGVKTPVYRVVNAADGVTRMPFGYSISIFLSLIRLIPINGTRWLSKFLQRRFLGYMHYGNLVFLSAVQNEPDEQGIGFKGLVVRMSPDIFWQASHVIKRWFDTLGKAALNDHSISEYSQKLYAIAKRHNA